MLSNKKKLKRTKTKRVERPKHIKYKKSDNQRTITFKPIVAAKDKNGIVALGAFLAIMFLCNLFFFTENGNNILVVVLLGVFFLFWYSVIIIVLYKILLKFVTTIQITIVKKTVTIKITPFQKHLSGEYDLSTIDQLFCIRHKHKGKRTKWYTYSLNSAGETMECLLKDLTRDEALYLEMAIENQIGIVDKKIEGEFRGKS